MMDRPQNVNLFDVSPTFDGSFSHLRFARACSSERRHVGMCKVSKIIYNLSRLVCLYILFAATSKAKAQKEELDPPINSRSLTQLCSTARENDLNETKAMEAKQRQKVPQDVARIESSRIEDR
jgi:hypothetical protein